MHVLDWDDNVLAMPKIARARSARLLMDGAVVRLEQVENGTLLYLPPGKRDPYDTVVVLETR